MALPTAVVYDLRHFRFKSDVGLVNDTTWLKAEDVNIAQADVPFDTNVRLRLVMSEISASGTLSRSTGAMQLQYSLDGGAYTNVTGASSNVRASASPNEADGAVCTRQLTQYATNTFVDGGFDEVNGLGTSVSPGADQDIEAEFCVQFRSADLAGLSAGAHTIDFRVEQPGGTTLDNYTAVPRYTFNVAAAAGFHALMSTGVG